MSLQPFVTREVLFTYFAGQATVLQKQIIEKWVEEKPDHEEFFYACLHEWEMQHLQYKADVNAAIARSDHAILSQTHFHKVPPVEQKSYVMGRKSGGWEKWIVAASFFFVLLSGAWFFRNDILYQSYKTGYGQISTVKLVDGSKVVLNANSVLEVPRFGFGLSDRKVHIKGEARFSVTHTPADKKFIVSTGSGFQVEVLGTEFNLTARKSGTKVILQKGKVKAIYKVTPEQPSSSLLMAPGDLVSVDEKQKKLQVKKVMHPEIYSAWQYGQFVFDNTPLIEIKHMLYDNYGLVVELKGIDGLQRTVSGSFKTKSAEDLLLAISEIVGARLIRQGTRVVMVIRD